MPVTTPHNDHSRILAQWRKMRDLVEGREAMLRSARVGTRMQGTGSLFSAIHEDYIPRLSGQTPEEYLTYCERADFFAATQRTVQGMTGLIMGKEPEWELPAQVERYTDDITLAAQNLREFSDIVITEELTTTRCAILVDYPADVPESLTIGQAESLNIRPFMRLYKAESIINWRVGASNGAQVLTMVVLSEQRDLIDDEYTSTATTVYRVLDLYEGRYRVRVLNSKGEGLESERYPTMRGQPMGYIPLAMIGGYELRQPILSGLADTNVAHYRNSADYEHGLHFTGLPQPYVTGVSDSSVALQIGSSSAWLLPDPNSKVAFLEFTGVGLGSIQVAMTDKQQRMAIMGARMLVDEKRTSEAQGTVESRTAGERSLLASVARDVSDAMRRALQWMADWVGASGDVQFILNTDYGAHRMDATMLKELVAAYQGGSLPLSVLVSNLQRGEIVPGDMDAESFRGELETDAPSIAAPATDAQQPGAMPTLLARLGAMATSRSKRGM